MRGKFEGTVMGQSFASVSIAGALLVAVITPIPPPRNTHRRHVRHHVVRVVEAAPTPYGLPGTYYPAPPFPLFLLPGPWWLPAHPVISPIGI